MRSLAALILSLSLAMPAQAQPVLSEVSGNWAGPSGGGFTFLARLTQNEDKLRLMIWGGGPDSPATDAGDPQFDNAEIALGAFATKQTLEVVDTGNGSILQLVTEYADEVAEGRSVVQIQYLDNQFTVIGFYLSEVPNGQNGEPLIYECDVDLWNGMVTENGAERKLPPMAAEELNASDWTFSAAFDRGYCARG